MVGKQWKRMRLIFWYHFSSDHEKITSGGLPVEIF